MGMKYEIGDIVKRNFAPFNVGVVVKTFPGTSSYWIQDSDKPAPGPCNYREDELDWVMSRRAYFQLMSTIKIF